MAGHNGGGRRTVQAQGRSLTNYRKLEVDEEQENDRNDLFEGVLML